MKWKRKKAIKEKKEMEEEKEKERETTAYLFTTSQRAHDQKEL